MTDTEVTKKGNRKLAIFCIAVVVLMHLFVLAYLLKWPDCYEGVYVDQSYPCLDEFLNVFGQNYPLAHLIIAVLFIPIINIPTITIPGVNGLALVLPILGFQIYAFRRKNYRWVCILFGMAVGITAVLHCWEILSFLRGP